MLEENMLNGRKSNEKVLSSDIEYKRFVWQLSSLIQKYEKEKNVIFMCIGTTSVSGDSLGPIVGSALKQNSNLIKSKSNRWLWKQHCLWKYR